MANLNREQYFERVRTLIGDKNDPDSIQALEDLTDTYNSLEKGISGDGIDWHQKFIDNDKAWADRYRNRFMNGDGGNGPSKQDSSAGSYAQATTVDYKDLFGN